MLELLLADESFVRAIAAKVSEIAAAEKAREQSPEAPNVQEDSGVQ